MRFNTVEREGVATFERILSRDIKWIAREQSVADVGIDSIIECTDHHGDPNGVFIAVQIKSGLGNVKKRNNSFRYYVAKKHHKYWSKVKIPLILVLYDPQNEKLYWEKINEKTQHKTKKGFRIDIPFTNNINTPEGIVIFNRINEEISDINNLISNPEAAKLIFDKVDQMLPDNTDNLSDYGLILLESGHFKEALALFNKAYKIDLKGNGYNQSEKTIIRKLNFSLTTLQLGRVKTTIRICNSCKEDLFRLYPNKDNKLFCHLYNLYGTIHHAQNEFEDGISSFEKAINIADDIGDLYEQHVSRNNIGRLYVDYAVIQKAEKLKIYKGLDYLHEAYKIAHKLENSLINRKDILLSNIATAYYYLKDFERAITNYNESLEMQIERYGEIHHAVANRYLNLANAHSNNGDDLIADTYQERSLKIYLEVFGTDVHPRLADLYFNMGARKVKKGKTKEGRKWIAKCIEIQNKLNLKSSLIEYGLSKLEREYGFKLE